MPMTSRTVAQQNPRCPASARRPASAVDLNAFTCGRSVSPGQRFAIVSTFRSNACTSTSSDGVGSSDTFMGRRLGVRAGGGTRTRTVWHLKPVPLRWATPAKVRCYGAPGIPMAPLASRA